MKQKNIILVTKILSKDVVDKNKTAFELVDFYSRIADIIERTNIAMGRKSNYKISTSSTVIGKLNTNVFASTH